MNANEFQFMALKVGFEFKNGVYMQLWGTERKRVMFKTLYYEL